MRRRIHRRGVGDDDREREALIETSKCGGRGECDDREEKVLARVTGAYGQDMVKRSIWSM